MDTEETTQRHYLVPELRWHPPDGTSHPTAKAHAVKSSTEPVRTRPMQGRTCAVATRVLP